MFKQMITIAAVAGLVFALGATASAEYRAFSWNYTDGSSGALNAGDVAGVPEQGYDKANWNNSNIGGGIVGYLGAAHPAVVDDTGATLPGVTISWYSDAQWTAWYPSAGETAADREMMYFGLIDQAGSGYEPSVIEINGIPYAEYDVVVYHLSNHFDRGVELSVVGQADTYVSQPNMVTGYVLDYKQVTSTDPANPTMDGNYSVHEGLTGSSVTVEWVPKSVGTWTDEAWITGLQIVEVPEPASLTLLLIGLPFVMRRKRR